jgi:polo-like kinase 1
MNEMIKRRKRLTEPETAYFMRQLLQSVQYLHDKLVIHRDLKLGNLFLDRNMILKVGDLGLASQLESADEKRKTICGTPNYIAPEVIQGDRATRGHSFEVDIWSMGVICYTCLVGKPPYEAKDVKATYQRILANEYSFPRDIAISNNAKDMIRSMLQSKPKDRPSLEDISMHNFFLDRTIPLSLPSSCTIVAPQWEENEYGELVCGPKNNSDASGPRKPCLPRSSSSQRRPFATRDVNVDRAPERSDRSKPSKQSREVIDMPGVVKTATNVGNNKSPPIPSAFQVFDETEEPRRTVSSQRKPPQSRSAEEDIVTRTASLSIRAQDASPYTSMNPSPREALAPSTGPSAPDNDALVLHDMIDRIDTVLEITARRSYSKVHPDSPSLTAFSRGGPTKWVSRYVDYTSKYGLGFLLSDGRYVEISLLFLCVVLTKKTISHVLSFSVLEFILTILQRLS